MGNLSTKMYSNNVKIVDFQLRIIAQAFCKGLIQVCNGYIQTCNGFIQFCKGLYKIRKGSYKIWSDIYPMKDYYRVINDEDYEEFFKGL